MKKPEAEMGVPLTGIAENQKYRVGDLVSFGDCPDIVPILSVNYAGQRKVFQFFAKTPYGENWIRVKNIQNHFTRVKNPEYFL